MSEIEQDATIGRENPYWWLWDDHLYLNVVQHRAMNEDERVKSIRLERFANLLERETPRGRVLANFVGSRQVNREKAS